MLIVSNTEVSTFNLCRRKHYYQFILSKEPQLAPLALYRGIIGHLAWEHYYRHGCSVAAGQEILDMEIMSLIKMHPGEGKHLEALMQLGTLLNMYNQYYSGDEPFEIVELEEKHSVPIADDLAYGLRLDMLVRFTRGPYRGDLVIVDNKFLYNFKTDIEIEMDSQLPKYIKTLQLEGHTISKGMFNQIRYRSLKNFEERPGDVFRRTPPITPSSVKMDNIWSEQIRTAQEIHMIKMKDTGEKAVRTLSPIACRACSYQGICHKELNNQPIINDLKFEYQESKYGYMESDE